ncbi:MAG: flavodoxin family protein [Deltaproteobacteria bacterium]|nr:flavodoxin family protein [Deltaproteobacteria bacterium]
MRTKILGVGGSPRRGGNTDILLKRILSGAEAAGMDTKTILLRDVAFSSCIGCERCRKDKICTGITDELTPFYQDIISSRGLVLVSPCYNYNVTALMKAFIDRLYCFYDFTDDHPRQYSSRLAGQGRTAVIAVVGEQTDPRDMGYAVEMLRMPLEALGYAVIRELPVYGYFHAGKVAESGDVMDRAEELGRALASSLM